MSKAGSSRARNSRSTGPNPASGSVRPNPAPMHQHVCIQRDAAGPAIQPQAPDLVRSALASPGQPLDTDTRAELEPHFGYDFSQVRVHSDEPARASARAVGAHAYTAGSHVVLGQPSAPGSVGQQELMAHELTHVVQQSRGPVPGTEVAEGLSVSDPGDAFEQQAGRAPEALRAPASAQAGAAAPAALTPLAAAAPARLSVQRVNDTSPDSDYTARQTSASETQASSGQLQAYTGLGSALVGAFTGLVGAYAAVRSANFAERSAQAAEDPPVAEPTQGGVSVNDADIPEIKGVDQPKAAGTEGEKAAGEGDKQRKGTAGNSKSKTKAKPADKPGDATSPAPKTGEDKDALHTWRLLTVRQGKDNEANFYISVRSAGKDIKDGGTEPGDAKGFLGGSMEANAAVNFKARPGEHDADGNASVRILIGGSNTPPRKLASATSWLGSGGPKANPAYTVQRFRGVVTFVAGSQAGKPMVAPGSLKAGTGSVTAGAGSMDGPALVNVDFSGDGKASGTPPPAKEAAPTKEKQA